MFEFRGIIANRNNNNNVKNKTDKENSDIHSAHLTKLNEASTPAFKNQNRKLAFGDKKNIYQSNQLGGAATPTTKDSNLFTKTTTPSFIKKIEKPQPKLFNNIGNSIKSSSSLSSSSSASSSLTSKPVDFLQYWAKNCILTDEKINELLTVNENPLFMTSSSPMKYSYNYDTIQPDKIGIKREFTDDSQLPDFYSLSNNDLNENEYNLSDLPELSTNPPIDFSASSSLCSSGEVLMSFDDFTNEFDLGDDDSINF